MGQRVDTRRRGDEFRHGHRQLRVENGIFGDEVGIHDRVLVALVMIGDHSAHCDLAARAGRGGDGNDRSDLYHDLHQARHLPDRRIGLGNARRCRLGGVHGGAAPDREEAVAAVFQRLRTDRLHRLHRGVCLHLIIDRVANTMALKIFRDGRDNGSADGWAGHDHDLVHVQLFEYLRDLLCAVRSAYHLRAGEHGVRKRERLLHDFAVRAALEYRKLILCLFKEALVHCVCDTDRRDSRRAAEKRLICFLHFKPLFPYLMRMTASYALCTASAILPLLHASPTVTTYGY